MSSVINSVMTVVSLVVIALTIVVGAFYADGENWTEKQGFFPYGVSSEKWTCRKENTLQERFCLLA